MHTLIIGGGLSGLALANALEQNGDDYLLVEARSRFGGRIQTHQLGGDYFDMGPAWFWQGQPRIAALIERFALQAFEQYAEGALLFEDEQGRVQRGRGYASMQGSLRLKGGLGALVAALVDTLSTANYRLDSAVVALHKTVDGIAATLNSGEELVADRVVLALPPRLAADITYTPSLPVPATRSLQSVSTWMAGQAKAVAVYKSPFWRQMGLSGDASSRFGPLVEIHDASTANVESAALFGFVGVSPQVRRDEQKLRQQVLLQLERLFGAEAAKPSQLYIKDWAFDAYTSTEADIAPLYAHPTYGMPQVLRDLWGGRLHISGTEMAPQFGGYLEGALEAAENTLETLRRQRN